MTGAAGFIGSHLVERLLDDGHDVVGIDAFTDYYARSDKEANLAEARRHDRFELIEADLRSASIEPLIEGADVVVNQAATPGLVLSWDDFERYQSCNLGALQRLAAAAVAVGTPHLVQASTSSVYGAEATGPESSATEPVSPYGVTKLAAEQLLHAYGTTAGLPFTVLRYFSVYGPRQRPDMAYRIFCEQIVAGSPITVYGDGLQSRSNTYVTDCVDATVAAMHRAPDASTFNVGGGAEVALLDAIEILGATLGATPLVQHRAVRPGDQRRTVADTAKALELLGWEPKVAPEEGLAAEAAWVRDRRGGR